MRVVDDDRAVAAIGAAGQQQNVGRKVLDSGNVPCGKPLGECAHQPRTRPQGRLARRFRGELAHQAHGHHAQPPGCAAAGEPIIERRQRAHVGFQIVERRVHAFGDVLGHRGGSLTGGQNANRVQRHGAQLGIGAAEVDQQGVHFVALSLPAARAVKSASSVSITSSARVPGGKARSRPNSKKHCVDI